MFENACSLGNSLAVQWLGFCTSTAGGTGLIPSRGTKILHAMQCDQKEKKEKKMPAVYAFDK